MTRIFLSILVSTFCIFGAAASQQQEPDPSKPYIKVSSTRPKDAGAAVVMPMSNVHSLITKHQKFFTDRHEQPIEVYQDALLDFLSLFYQCREDIFVIHFKSTKEQIPKSLLGRRVLGTIKLLEGASVHELFDLNQPEKAKVEIKNFCAQHKVQPFELLFHMRNLMLEIAKANLLKEVFEKDGTQITSVQGERGHIELVLKEMEPLREKAMAAVEKQLKVTLPQIYPFLYKETQDENALPRLLNLDYSCSFEDPTQLHMASLQSQADWNRYHALYTFVENLGLIGLASDMVDDFSEKNDIPNLVNKWQVLLLNHFNPSSSNWLDDSDDSEDYGSIMLTAPPFLDTLAVDALKPDPSMKGKDVEVNLKVFFANFEHFRDQDVMRYFIENIAIPLFVSKEKYFDLYMRHLGVKDIPLELYARWFRVRYEKKKRELLSAHTTQISSRFVVEGSNHLVVEDFKKKNVDRYDLLPLIREALLQKSVWDYMCESFNDLLTQPEPPTEDTQAILRLWRKGEKAGEEAFEEVKQILDVTHDATQSPWKRYIPIPGNRPKKTFTRIVTECGNEFDNPLNMERALWKDNSGVTLDQWNLYIAKYLLFTNGVIRRMAKEMREGHEAAKATVIRLNQPRSSKGGISTATRERLQKKLQAASKEPKKEVASAPSKNNTKQSAVVTKAPAAEEVKIPEVFREKPEEKTTQAVAPVTAQVMYSLQDLPMVKDVLLPILKDPASMKLTDESLIRHIVDLVNYFAEYRMAHAQLLFKANGSELKPVPGDFGLQIWQTKNKVEMSRAGDFIALIDFSSSKSKLYEDLLDWSKGNYERKRLLWILRQDLIYEIYLLQLSSYLIKHVDGLNTVGYDYFQSGGSVAEDAAKMTASTEHFRNLWACYVDVLKAFVKEQENVSGFTVVDDFRDEIVITLFQQGLDKDSLDGTGKSQREVYGKYLGLLDKAVLAMCAPSFRSYFDPTNETRMLSFPGKGIPPTYVGYVQARALHMAQQEELDKVKAISKMAMNKLKTAQDELRALKMERDAQASVEAQYQKMLAEKEAEAAKTLKLSEKLDKISQERVTIGTELGTLKKKQAKLEKAKAQREKLLEEKDGQISVMQSKLDANNLAKPRLKLHRIAAAKTRVNLRFAREAIEDYKKFQLDAVSGFNRAKDELKSIRSELTAAYHEIDQTSDRLFEEEQAHKDTNQSLKDVEKAHKTATLRLGDVEAALKATTQRLVEEQKAHGVTREQLQAANKEMDGMVETFKEELEAFKQKTEAHVKTYVDGLKEELGQAKEALEKAQKEEASLRQKVVSAEEAAQHWSEQNNLHHGRVHELQTELDKYKKAHAEACEDVEIIRKQCDELYYARIAAEKKLAESVVAAPNPGLEEKVKKLKAAKKADAETIKSLNATIAMLMKQSK